MSEPRPTFTLAIPFQYVNCEACGLTFLVPDPFLRTGRRVHCPAGCDGTHFHRQMIEWREKAKKATREASALRGQITRIRKSGGKSR